MPIQVTDRRRPKRAASCPIQSVNPSLGRPSETKTNDNEAWPASYFVGTSLALCKDRNFDSVFRRQRPVRATASTCDHETSCAAALKHHGFFQRARIVNVGVKYGFPSMNPDGTKNLACELQAALKQRKRRWKRKRQARRTKEKLAHLIDDGSNASRRHAIVQPVQLSPLI